MDAARADPVGRWALLFILLVAGGVFIVIGARELGPSLAAAHGRGVRGTLIITDESCGGYYVVNCAYSGTFTSDDGRLVLEDANFDGAGDIGEEVSAIYSGRGFQTTVYRDGTIAWTFNAFTIVVGGTLVVMAFYVFIRSPHGDPFA